eukprot:CAMPEP_0167756818 /NCGR_PEP_ID=MMETSP0110_2-20121227/9590_1 /TAXON_ID=629695 /ORGANISM="Gymnochlora sp., Strain CCMP2014" /LENGTH=202 /DNA_ID=CAMNT_0007642957 /DNA_START=475 /DNA_END=1080 /DNA_ORIENTATION=-
MCLVSPFFYKFEFDLIPDALAASLDVWVAIVGSFFLYMTAFAVNVPLKLYEKIQDTHEEVVDIQETSSIHAVTVAVTSVLIFGDSFQIHSLIGFVGLITLCIGLMWPTFLGFLGTVLGIVYDLCYPAEDDDGYPTKRKRTSTSRSRRLSGETEEQDEIRRFLLLSDQSVEANKTLIRHSARTYVQEGDEGGFFDRPSPFNAE